MDGRQKSKMSDSDGSYQYPSDDDYDENDREDDDENGLTPPPPAHLARSGPSHTAMELGAAEGAMRSLITRAATETGLSPSSSAILLRFFKWDFCELMRKAAAGDLERGMAEAGVAWETTTASAEGCASFFCIVCSEDYPAAEGDALACGHMFCQDCWRGMLTNAIDSGLASGQTALHTMCMMPKCRLAVGEGLFEARLSPADYMRFKRLLVLDFVNESDDVRRCPHPGCDDVVANSVRRRAVTCGQRHRFCFECSGAAHAPVS